MLALWLAAAGAQAQSPMPPASRSAGPAIAAAQNPVPFEEQRVAAIRVVSEGGEVLSENPAELAHRVAAVV